MKPIDAIGAQTTDVRSDMTKEQWSALADTKLQELLQTSSGALLLAVIRESKDRLEGKPMQQINTTLSGNVTNTIQIVRFSDGVVIDHLPNVVRDESQLRTISGNEPQAIDKT